MTENSGVVTVRWSRGRRTLALAAVLIGAATVVAALLLVRGHNPQPYSGDEPHYLLIAGSLVLDGDVDVKNDYLNGRYLTYYPQPIDPHINGSHFTVASAHWYSQHGVGLPAVLSPGVLIDGPRGATATMALFGMLVLVLSFFWARRVAGKGWPPVVAAAALGFAPFFLGLQSRIFPDLPAAALLLAALLLLEDRGRRPWQLFLLGALVAVAPWFHFKNVLVCAPIAAFALVQVGRSSTGRRRISSALLFSAPVICSAIGYELAVHSWYGSWSPTAMFPPGTRVFALDPVRGLAAGSFDGSRGLLSNDPALMLIFAGLPIWAWLRRRSFALLAIAVAPAILIEATFDDWSGGFAPAARYALQFAPALVPAIALALREASIAFRVLAGTVVGFQLALAAAFVWLRPSWGFMGVRSPFLAALDGRVGLAVDRAMPMFDVHGTLIRGGWQLAAWASASVVLLAYGLYTARRETESIVDGGAGQHWFGERETARPLA
jgi:hypothetical protein